MRIPKNSLGFVLVRNLDDAGKKIEKLLEPFGSSTPNPVVLARVATGLGVGLDTAGNFAVALLPSRGAEQTPLVILPVSDYKTFARSMQADASGAICRVTLLGEDVLVGRAGGFAMMMNIDQRGTLESLVSKPPAAAESVDQLSVWLANQDVAVVMMPAGLTQLSRWKQPRPQRVLYGRNNLQQQQSKLLQWLPVIASARVRNWLRTNADLASVGVSVDPDNNVSIGERVLLKQHSHLARTLANSSELSRPLLGLASQPFVLLGGGPLPEGWGKNLADHLLQSEQEQAAFSGLDKISDELWEKEGRAFRLLLEEISGCSIAMLPGKKGEPLLGNFFGVATVADVQSYFDSLNEVIETWNEVYQQSTSDIKPTFELKSSVVDSKQRREMVVDVATSARDPNVPEFNWMLEAAFGREGKLKVQLWQIDQKRFLFGLATEEQMVQASQRLSEGKAKIPTEASAGETDRLMPEASRWKVLVQPQACLTWASRVMNEYLGIGLSKESEVEFPLMPDSPPLGIVADYKGRLLQCDTVCPAATWTILGKFYAEFNHPR